MSHIRWIPPPSGHAPTPTGWRFFPWLIAAAMGVVVAVNAVMIYAALSSFPGTAASGGFDLSNRYNVVLRHVQREAELGWTLLAKADGTGRPEVRLSDRDGSPLRGVSVAASAERPLGERASHPLAFHETEPGHYVADTALTAPGQWDLNLSASTGGRDMAATRRIIVR